MLNLAAFEVMRKIPNLPTKPVEVKDKEVKPEGDRYMDRVYKSRNGVMKALQDNKSICASEIGALTGVSHSGIRYILSKFRERGLIKSKQVKVGIKKPITYYSLLELAC
ncbi:MAG: hypothetical protein COA78_21200 [Blastopirellula sp.]|nr:MAG: hypothetical protein COA78_21200 [Blastopirellula sp.]